MIPLPVSDRIFFCLINADLVWCRQSSSSPVCSIRRSAVEMVRAIFGYYSCQHAVRLHQLSRRPAPCREQRLAGHHALGGVGGKLKTGRYIQYPSYTKNGHKSLANLDMTS
jgi:hypothetical protein